MDISTIDPQDIPISILFLITAFPLTTQQAPGHHAPLTFPHVIQARDGEIIGLGGNHRHILDIQGGAPQVISWFIIPLTIDISPTKTIVIGVICTNLAIQGAPPCRCQLFMGFYMLKTFLDIYGSSTNWVSSRNPEDTDK